MEYLVRLVAPGDAAVREERHAAADEASLRTALRSRGLVVLRVDRPPHGAPSRPAGARRGPRNPHPLYPLLCRELRTLVRAGMTVVEAVDTLAARDGLPGHGRAHGGENGLACALRDALQRGQALSSALASLPDAPAVLVAAVKAGERTSNLVEALDDYLRFDGLTAQLRRKVASAAIYPALVTTLGIGISLFLLMVVLPNFARMYRNLRAQARGANAMVIEFSTLLSEHRAAAFAVLLAAALALALWVRCGAARRQAARLAMRVPWLRARVQDFQLAMMYQALALLLKGGYSVAEAMAIAGGSALAPHLNASLAVARGQIESGRAVSQSLSAAGLCDEVDRRLMAAAERNGDFHLAADVVSRLHGERFELFVERLTRIAEPLLLLGVALLVGTIVVMMYLPVFDMATRMR